MDNSIAVSNPSLAATAAANLPQVTMSAPYRVGIHQPEW